MTGLWHHVAIGSRRFLYIIYRWSYTKLLLISSSQKTVRKVSKGGKGSQKDWGPLGQAVHMQVNRTWQNASKAATSLQSHTLTSLTGHGVDGKSQLTGKGQILYPSTKREKKRFGKLPMNQPYLSPSKNGGTGPHGSYFQAWKTRRQLGETNTPQLTQPCPTVHCLLCYCFCRNLGGWPYLWRLRQRRHKGKSSRFPLAFVTNWPTPLSSGPAFSFCLLTCIQYISTYLLLTYSAGLSLFISACQSGISIFCCWSLFPFPSLMFLFRISVLSVAHRLISCCAGCFSCLGEWTAVVLEEGCLWKPPSTPQYL